MIWIIVAALVVPLWLGAAAGIPLVIRNRRLRNRRGDVVVRRRLDGQTRWTRGYGVWVHDVFAYRGSPALWIEHLVWVTDASARGLVGSQETRKLWRLGDHPTVVLMTAEDGSTVEFAVPVERALDLLGPFAVAAASPRSRTER